MQLREFIAAYRARCRLLLEIKNRDWESVARRVEGQADAGAGRAGGGRPHHGLFLQLDSPVYAHRIDPRCPLVFNLEPEHDVDFARRTLTRQPFLHGLCVHISTLDVDMMGLVRERGKRIAVYTCNSEAEIGRALALEVDVLISDVPQMALRMRDE